MKEQQPVFRTKASLFFLITFGWSIVFWGLTVALGGINQFPGSILQFVGGAGPLVSALIVIHFFEPPTVRKDFWGRTLAPRRISWRWLAPAMLVHPAIIFIAAAAESALGGALQFRSESLTDPLALASMVFFVFMFGPLPEEMGWRGVGYERIEKGSNALRASLILGAAWAAWHIPLFFIEGTFQQQLGAGSPRFWTFLASNIPLTVLITWVYNHTDRSILVAALVHFSGNIVGAVLPKSDRLAFFELIGLALFAVYLAFRYGKSLTAGQD